MLRRVLASQSPLPEFLPAAPGSHSFMGSDLSEESFDELLQDAIGISDRFIPEPVFARTGKGFMHPAGVAENKAAKS